MAPQNALSSDTFFSSLDTHTHIHKHGSKNPVNHESKGTRNQNCSSSLPHPLFTSIPPDRILTLVVARRRLPPGAATAGPVYRHHPSEGSPEGEGRRRRRMEEEEQPSHFFSFFPTQFPFFPHQCHVPPSRELFLLPLPTTKSNMGFAGREASRKEGRKEEWE